MANLHPRLKKYIFIVIVIAILTFLGMYRYYNMPDYSVLTVFTLLSLMVESLVIVLPGGGAVSVGFAVSLTAMIITGPLGAAISCSVGLMLRYGKTSREPTRHIFNTPLYKTLFNGAQSFLSVGLASIVYYSFNTDIGDTNFYTNIVPLLLSIIIYVIVNASIMTKLLSMLNNKSFVNMFLGNFKWMLPNCFIVASLGIFLSIIYLNYGTAIMLIFFGPLLLARFSFKLYLDMKQIYFETVYALSKTVEAKDPYTDGHSKRVAEYAEKIGKRMKLKNNQIDTLKTAALLHDIGKIGISDNLLNKPDKLTNEEFSIIKTHPAIGVDILSTVDFLKDVRDVILKHHEKYGGSGYPLGLREDEIPLEAYILAAADAFDAMTSDRSYRKGMTKEKAISILQEDAGSHFHPQVVECFVKIILEELSSGPLPNFQH
ncbi:HD-GYP domain-containing protein [Alkaliphilus hydrothermalis]|uniref:Nucleotidyltransferase with HDIG domain n=1 Tax=Alkaliphilus hydrothermalis TaxID=1482730 RepID=A0ABS2NR40_9FIRM|nr:HD domain-containing phosphohydrolase [Alkaliphilus hydrothermalis]MBM7615386.1 putative nucleotidyltransferase with HDIG domain [Alkaliphilus hydrothermalis]